MDVEFTVSDDYSFYVQEFFVGITNDLFDMHSIIFIILIIFN